MRYGWTLDRATWQRVSRGLARRHWRHAPFAGLHKELVPEQSGVYAICTPGLSTSTGLFGTLYNSLYVGQARNLRSRFVQHYRQPGLELTRAVNCFRSLEFWFVVAPAGDIDDLEAVLIDCLGPPANRQAGIAARVGSPVRI